MDNVLQPEPEQTRRRYWIGYLLFCLSGAAALIYEVSWTRQIGLVIGHTANSAAVVLTSFFVGLAFGYSAGGRLAARVSALQGYAIAEFVAAGWACLIPNLLSVVESDVHGLVINYSASSQLIAHWVGCFLLLLPATVALGATLPLIAHWLSSERDTDSGRVATAYALNTVGAFVGVMTTTFGLLILVGVRSSGYLAAMLSVGCGIGALVLAWTGPRHIRLSLPDTTDLPGPTRCRGLQLTPAFVSAVVSGFGIVALEVLYTRLFSLVFHNSTYTFGAVLAVTLVGLAFGASLARKLTRVWGSQRLQAAASGIGAITVLVSVLLFARLTKLEYFSSGETFAGYVLAAFGLVATIVLPPIIVLGMILPSTWLDSGRHGRTDGGIVGRMTMMNALASACGAAAASLVLLPNVGLWVSFVVVALPFALVGCFGLFRERPVGAVVCGLAFTVGAIVLASPAGPEQWTAGREELVQHWDSAYGQVDVVRDRTTGALKVRQNLHYRFGTTGADAPRAYRQAQLPLLLHRHPTDVAFLGLGTGLTAAGAIPHSDVERVVVVELIPEVVDAARMLVDANLGVVDHPKVEIRVDDARHFLTTTDRRFDVIVSDLFVPWESETGYLYTVEHYQATRRRLNPGGLFCQWLAVYQLGARDFETIADSFTTVFPNTSVWWGHDSADRAIMALVGSDSPIEVDESTLNDRLGFLRDRPATDPGLRTADDLRGLYVGDWRVLHPESLNTDEFPRVEFLSPLSHRNRTTLQGDAFQRYLDLIPKGLPRHSVLVSDSKKK